MYGQRKAKLFLWTNQYILRHVTIILRCTMLCDTWTFGFFLRSIIVVKKNSVMTVSRQNRINSINKVYSSERCRRGPSLKPSRKFPTVTFHLTVSTPKLWPGKYGATCLLAPAHTLASLLLWSLVFLPGWVSRRRPPSMCAVIERKSGKSFIKVVSFRSVSGVARKAEIERKILLAGDEVLLRLNCYHYHYRYYYYFSGGEKFGFSWLSQYFAKKLQGKICVGKICQLNADFSLWDHKSWRDKHVQGGLSIFSKHNAKGLVWGYKWQSWKHV